MSIISTPEHITAFFNPAIYPHPAAKIKMVETHISWLFLAGDFAYKFKKPLDLGFLDFSTLEKRKLFCERELRLNSLTAPDTYLEVLPVYRHDGRIGLAGSEARGEIMDYCLKMVRFAEQDLFDQRLSSGTFIDAWMDQLASDCVQYHSAATADYNIDHIGHLHAHIQKNLEIADHFTNQGIDHNTLSELKAFAERSLTDLAPQLYERQKSGYIHHCHGDLHLKNIALIDGYPRLFDCIEFNDNFATIDRMNDIAFLIMDCYARGRPDLGMRFLSRYLESTGDYTGLQLLPLYLFYRATVRGKVACLLAEEQQNSAQKKALTEAAGYFDLALRFTRQHAVQLFAIGGLSGSGKSVLALKGSGVEEAIIIRSDATRKRIAPRHPDLALYGKAMHRFTYQQMFEDAGSALEAGFSVILDATFLHPESRCTLHSFAEQHHLTPHLFWLDIDATTLRARVRERSAEGADISDADISVLEKQLIDYQRPEEAWITFLSSNENWPNE